jgi:predicted methyltransferase
VTTRSEQASGRSDASFRLAGGHLRRMLVRGLAALSPAKRRAKAQWLARDGVEFLRAAGIGPGDTVVDFGCGAGAYSIPAAWLVGADGLVVAVDVRARARRSLLIGAARQGLRNIRTARHLAELACLLKDRHCKAVLLYDVLHFMDADTRRRLYDACGERLGPDGFLSVFPTHLAGDDPAQWFRNMTIEDVSREIEGAGFRLSGRVETTLWHNPGCVRGTVLTFRKANGETAGPAATQ